MKKFLTTSLILILIAIIAISGFFIFRDVYKVYMAEIDNEQSNAVWDGSYDTDWYNENLTEYDIYTAEELAGLSKLVSEGITFENKLIRLNNDIYLNSSESFVNEWVPIGLQGKVFSGSFDGLNHTVNGVYINNENLSYVGLFGYVKSVGAEIKNIKLNNFSILCNSYIGGLVGVVSNSYNFENIEGSYLTLKGKTQIGGLFGDTQFSSIKVNDVKIDCFIQQIGVGNNHSFGGLIGGSCNYADIIIEDCSLNVGFDVEYGFGGVAGLMGASSLNVNNLIINMNGDIKSSDFLNENISNASNLAICNGLFKGSNDNYLISDSYISGLVTLPEKLATYCGYTVSPYDNLTILDNCNYSNLIFKDNVSSSILVLD